MKKEKKNCHVKKGDMVQVLSGQQKGFVGKIQFLNPQKSFVFIEGITPRSKFKKLNSKTEAVKTYLEIPIHLSNVMLWDSAAKTSSKTNIKLIDGKKVRYFKKSGNIVL